MKCPCQGCTERHITCHQTCSKYKDYRNNIESLNSKRRAAKQVNEYQFGLIINSCKIRERRKE